MLQPFSREWADFTPTVACASIRLRSPAPLEVCVIPTVGCLLSGRAWQNGRTAIVRAGARAAVLCGLLVCGLQPLGGAEQGQWVFAVSGDSRNCGDVVMPAIAASVLSHDPAFYWHLGDFRKISAIDEDMKQQPRYRASGLLTDTQYQEHAWEDFISSQIDPFGELRVYLGIGNHELINFTPPNTMPTNTAGPSKITAATRQRTRAEYLHDFEKWMTWPNLAAQRAKDNPADLRPRTYYHWVERGVDFINLDNATSDQFDEEQMRWLGKVIDRDRVDPEVKALVVGMHAALPGSISADHSMEQSSAGVQSGRLIYSDLLALHYETHKPVYLLASHSHFYMAGIFRTEYWRLRGGVLPGWIVGTAGAQRYPLPGTRGDALESLENTYGYLLATVSASGEITFAFQRIEEKDIPKAVSEMYTGSFVHVCFDDNSRVAR